MGVALGLIFLQRGGTFLDTLERDWLEFRFGIGPVFFLSVCLGWFGLSFLITCILAAIGGIADERIWPVAEQLPQAPAVVEPLPPIPGQ